MKPEPFDASLDVLRRRVPFRPFTVALLNGDRFEVDHVAALQVRDGTAVFIAPGGVPWIFDHESVSQFVGDLMDQSKAG